MSNFNDQKALSSTTKQAPSRPSKEASPPPSYTTTQPDITAAFSRLTLDQRQSARPVRDQCIAHLKLLECFHELRETTATTDGLYGFWDRFVPSHLNERDHATLLTRIREKRWSIYVAQAAKRFESWWQNCVLPRGSTALAGKNEESPSSWDHDVALEFSKSTLPPIDVLMVWHTFMLNPRDYLSDCIRYGKQGFWSNGFPWNTVNACIDNETFEYGTSKEAVDYFESCTNQSYDALKMPLQIRIPCPRCTTNDVCPWTTCDNSHSWTGSSPGEYGIGFAEKDFSKTCPSCNLRITHDKLRAHKFYNDVLRLQSTNTLMPATLLDHNGKFGEKHGSLQDEHFPNDLLLKGGLDKEIIQVLNPKNMSEPLVGHIEQIRSLIEAALKDGRTIRKATGSLSRSRLRRPERIAIRRMMSCYWDNSSMFSVDLVGAVIRQGVFIEKMHAIDWLHSPSISATMDRLLVKYSRFFSIMGKHSDKVAVPTLDVDLAWHTHQLSCKSYYTYATAKTGTFIDHDDKIDEGRLSDAFEWTSKTYQKMFNEVYSECTCWYCEAIRESHTTVFDGIKPGHKNLASDLDRLHSQPTFTENPHNGPHISAHNAIKTQGHSNRALKYSRDAKAHALEVNYKKACLRAKKKGRQPPARDEYLTSAYAYGYPIYLPYYAPYIGDPCISGGMYAGNPGCANVAPGAAGNCCKGTCGGMVAAGGCGGGSGGGCAGGSVGGCGGGGGGGGGCGGGGGGGGGGCGGGGGG